MIYQIVEKTKFSKSLKFIMLLDCYFFNKRIYEESNFSSSRAHFDQLDSCSFNFQPTLYFKQLKKLKRSYMVSDLVGRVPFGSAFTRTSFLDGSNSGGGTKLDNHGKSIFRFRDVSSISIHSSLKEILIILSTVLENNTEVMFH